MSPAAPGGPVSWIQQRSRLQPAASPPLGRGRGRQTWGPAQTSQAKSAAQGCPSLSQCSRRTILPTLFAADPWPPLDLSDERRDRPSPVLLRESTVRNCFRPHLRLRPSGEHQHRPHTKAKTLSKRHVHVLYEGWRGSCQSLGSRKLSPHTHWPSTSQASLPTVAPPGCLGSTRLCPPA